MFVLIFCTTFVWNISHSKSDFNQTGIFWSNSWKIHRCRISWKLSSDCRVVSYGRTDGHDHAEAQPILFLCVNTTRQSITQHFIYIQKQYILSGPHVSTLKVILRPSKKTDPRVHVSLHCGIPNAYKCLLGKCKIHKYTQEANRIWLPTQPRHYTTREKNTTKSSVPEDGHKVARNMLSNLQTATYKEK